MPYIRPDRRAELDIMLETSIAEWLDMDITIGDVNYLITNIVAAYLHDQRAANYTRINSVIGVLECAKLELYRRIASPYEDGKASLNGDIERYTR